MASVIAIGTSSQRAGRPVAVPPPRKLLVQDLLSLAYRMKTNRLNVGVHHNPHQLPERHLGRPAEISAGHAGIRQEQVDLQWAVVAWINLDEFTPVQINVLEGFLHEFPYRVGLPRPDHVVGRTVLLQHRPHGLHVLRSIAPIAPCSNAPERQARLSSRKDIGNRPGDLPAHEDLAATGALMVEQDPIAGEQLVPISIRCDHPVCIHLGYRIRAPWVERGLLVLGGRSASEHLTARCLIEPRVDAAPAQRFKDTRCPQPRHISCVLRHIEAHLDMALRAKVVNFIRSHVIDQAHQLFKVCKITIVSHQPPVGLMRILIHVVNPLRIKRRCSPNETMNLVALRQQQLREVRAILTGQTGDDGALHSSELRHDRSRLLWPRPGRSSRRLNGQRKARAGITPTLLRESRLPETTMAPTGTTTQRWAPAAPMAMYARQAEIPDPSAPRINAALKGRNGVARSTSTKRMHMMNTWVTTTAHADPYSP